MDGETVPDDAGIDIGFEPGGAVGGSSGCNTFGGTYLVDGDTVRFADLMSTLMGCEEEILEREGAFATALSAVETWSVSGGELVLADAAGEELLAFVPLEPAGVTGITWALVELAGAAVPADAGITATFEEGGRVTGSAGCNTYFGDVLIDGGRITVGPLGSTRMACDGDGVMEREATFLDAMAQAESWAFDGDRLVVALSTGDQLVFQPTA